MPTILDPTPVDLSLTAPDRSLTEFSGLRVLEYRRCELFPTTTYKKRVICWVPADKGYARWDGRLGNLTIKLQHAKSGVRRRLEVDTYAVEEDEHPEPGDHGGRAFWLVNLTDKEQEKPYRCVVGGLTPKCGCQAGDCKVVTGCKHMHALEYLLGANDDEENILDEESGCWSGLVYHDAPGEMTTEELIEECRR